MNGTTEPGAGREETRREHARSAEEARAAGERRWSEELEIYASDLVARAKELIEEGNVRRLIVRTEGGRELLEVPLTAGVAVGGVLAVMAPVFAALGALAAFAAKVRLEIVREEPEDETSPSTTSGAAAAKPAPSEAARRDEGPPPGAGDPSI